MNQLELNSMPGIPLVESPLFTELRRTLPEEVLKIADELHAKGYAVIRFPEDRFDDLAVSIKKNLEGKFDFGRWSVEGGGLRIQDAWQFDEDVRAIACNQGILSLLSLLYGRVAFPFQTLNFPVGTEQHYHSDSVHFSSFPERFMCGVWVALEDIHADAGPLCYYPGSHRLPIIANEEIGHSDREGATTQEVYHGAWQALVKHSGFREETFCARQGDALIWAANLLHGGTPHLDRARTRWSQVTHYYFQGCSYYTPMHTNLAQGRIAFRDPFDILTGEAVPCRPFDPVAYLLANPDVAAAGTDPEQHYRTWGRLESRRLSP